MNKNIKKGKMMQNDKTHYSIDITSKEISSCEIKYWVRLNNDKDTEGQGMTLANALKSLYRNCRNAAQNDTYELYAEKQEIIDEFVFDCPKELIYSSEDLIERRKLIKFGRGKAGITGSRLLELVQKGQNNGK